MRRNLFLSALALSACGRRAPTAAPAAGTPLRIVALGDSLALGVGASSPARGFVFRAYLDVRRRYPLARIDSFAIGGSTADDVLRLQVARLRGVHPGIVLLCDGGNDVVHKIPAAEFASSYDRLVSRVRALAPGAAIVCCGVPDVGLSPLFTGSDHWTMRDLSQEDDVAVREIARRHGASFVDLYAVTRDKHGEIDHFLSDDRFHPSDQGYALFAAALSPVLLRAAATHTSRSVAGAHERVPVPHSP